MQQEYYVATDVQAYYTVKDIMRIFKCGRDKAYQIMNLKGFPMTVIGGKILVHPVALQRWIDKNSFTVISAAELATSRMNNR